MTSSKERKIWLNGEILNVSDAKINVLSPTSQFGANVFEGIRCYWNEEEKQLYAFRLESHYKRLINSIKMFRLENKYTAKDFQKALVDVVHANEYKEDIAVRQTVFVDGFGSWFATGPIGMFVAPIPKSRIVLDGKKGYDVCVSSWQRISDRNISPKVKVGANYINSRNAQLEALQNGYDAAIFLNDQGKVSEGPGSCLFIIRDNVLLTPPLTASILESITRDTILEIAKNELKMEVVEREIDRTELYISDEAFLCGSAMEIVPILSVDKIKLNNQKMSVVGKITEKYLEVVYGKNKKYSHWLTPIY